MPQAALTGAALNARGDRGRGGACGAAECEPFTDPIATEWYRRKMAGVFVQRALEQIAA